MNYQFPWKCISLSIIILRASAGDPGNIDYQANSGYGNVDSQASNPGDVTGWLMAEGAQYDSAGPDQAQLHDDGQTSPFLVGDSDACSMRGTYDIQEGSSGIPLNKGGLACKNESPPTMQQRKTKPSRTHEDIIPDVMPRWPIKQLEPNRQRCDHETYSVPACAEKEVANFVSLFIYDLPVCRPYFDGPCHDSELLWCCQLLVPTWLEPTMYWSYAGLNCALQTNLLLL